jgi:Icc-related predicted phosphoesterase
MVSAAYASNLESTIQKYDNLKLWCHGHMHESCHYELFGTRIVCNPLGYFDENPYFKPDGVIIDTDEL